MRKTLLYLLLLTTWSSVCRGQVPAASYPTDTLDAAAVTGTAARILSPVQTLSGARLHGSASSSVADALRYFSGLQIKDYGGIGGLKTVNVRSLGSMHTGIFYDGVKIENAQNGQVDLGRFAVDNLEEISIYNAQRTGTLQSATDYASASAVYIKTKVPVFSDRAANVKARMKYGSFSTYAPSLRIEQRIGKASMSADAMYVRTEGDYRFHLSSQYEDTTARRANGDVETMRAELGFFAHPFGGEMQVHAYCYASERGLPGPVIRRISDLYASEDRQQDKDIFLQASWRKDCRHSAVMVNAKGSSDRLEYESTPKEETYGAHIHNQYLQRSIYTSTAWSWYPAGWISANIAVDGRWSDLDCDVVNFKYVQRRDVKTALAANLLTGGFSAQASLLHTYISDVTAGSSTPMSRWTPAVLLGWGGRRLNTRAFYKNIFRAPTLNDLYYTFTGNSGLKPEYTSQWDLGADWKAIDQAYFRTGVSVDVYYNEIRDKIVAMPVSSQFRWSMMNFGLVRGYGTEFRVESELREGGSTFNLMMNYTFERAMDCTYPDSHWFKGQIPYTPAHSASAILSLGDRKWKAQLSGLYTGIRYSASDNSRSSRLDPWMTMDMTVSRTIKKRDTEIEAGIDINNILNRRYEVVARYPMPGTSALVKLTVTI